MWHVVLPGWYKDLYTISFILCAVSLKTIAVALPEEQQETGHLFMRRAFGRIINDVPKLSQPQMTTPYIGILIFGGILSILFLGFIFLLVNLYSVRFIMWSDKNIDLAVKSNMWKMATKVYVRMLRGTISTVAATGVFFIFNAYFS